MLIFINGSMNSGKTTTSRALAQKIGATFVNVDDLRDTIPDFNIKTDFPKVIDLGIRTINKHLANGHDVVANYVITEQDYTRIKKEVNTRQQYFITLAPKREVVQGQRGDRILSEWELQRIQYHYDIGIPNPSFGYIVDNSDSSIEQTVNEIIKIIGLKYS